MFLNVHDIRTLRVLSLIKIKLIPVDHKWNITSVPFLVNSFDCRLKLNPRAFISGCHSILWMPFDSLDAILFSECHSILWMPFDSLDAILFWRPFAKCNTTESLMAHFKIPSITRGIICMSLVASDCCPQKIDFKSFSSFFTKWLFNVTCILGQDRVTTPLLTDCSKYMERCFVISATCFHDSILPS